VIFYTPFDIGYKIAKFLPVKIVCAAMKEIYRQVNVAYQFSRYFFISPYAYKNYVFAHIKENIKMI